MQPRSANKQVCKNCVEGEKLSTVYVLKDHGHVKLASLYVQMVCNIMRMNGRGKREINKGGRTILLRGTKYCPIL